MGANEQAGMMKDLSNSTNRALSIPVKLALGWAVEKLTGERLPAPEPPTADRIQWSLRPLRE